MHLPDMLWTTSWIRSKTLIINTPTKNSGDTGFRWCHEIPTKTHLPITPQRRSIKGGLGNSKSWPKIGIYMFESQVSFRFHGVPIQPTIHHGPWKYHFSCFWKVLQLLLTVTYPARDALGNRLSCAQTESGPASIKRCATTCQIYGVMGAGSNVSVIA